MLKMIDFSDMPEKKKGYGGANGRKISVIYKGDKYMIKFPPVPQHNKDMSYANSCISEYIGCQIFRSVGIPAQETVLGTHVSNGREKIVVACKDFTSPGVTLSDFASVKNTVIDSAHKGYGTELADVCKTIDEQRMMNSDALRKFFWSTFIVDAFIGNWDRHNGNWGFLYDELNDTNTLAPIYDCGSSLYPQADEDIMKKVLSDKQELRARVFDAPTSALTQNGKRINYFKFISSLENADCNAALRRIVPQIDMSKINKIIDEIPCISDLQKHFYKTMLTERKEKILDYSLKKLKAISVDKDFSERNENNAMFNEQDKKYREAIREIFEDSKLITKPNISQPVDDFLARDASPASQNFSQNFDDIGDDER